MKKRKEKATFIIFQVKPTFKALVKKEARKEGYNLKEFISLHLHRSMTDLGKLPERITH